MDITNTTYRNFTISRSPNTTPFRGWDYEFAHVNFDGPGDDRCGFGATPEECVDAIDEYYEERETIANSRGYEP